MEHKFLVHEKCDQPGSCMFCDGGLAYCTVCKCGEGELATDCPGYPVAQANRELVYAGKLDYVRGEWVTK